jgi:hypothetical protein
MVALVASSPQHVVYLDGGRLLSGMLGLVFVLTEVAFVPCKLIDYNCAYIVWLASINQDSGDLIGQGSSWHIIEIQVGWHKFIENGDPVYHGVITVL